jgi:hypothetical protein
LHGWTTPDAYSGDISDPMSRKSYMWNRNNPVSYADPSGYISQDSVPVETSAFMAANEESIANSIEQEMGPDAAQEYVNKILQNPNISDFVKDTMRAVGTRLSGWKAEIQKDGGYKLRNPNGKYDYVRFKPPSANPQYDHEKDWSGRMSYKGGIRNAGGSLEPSNSTGAAHLTLNELLNLLERLQW